MMPERNAGDAPIADVLAACDEARNDLKTVLNPSAFHNAETFKSVATLVNHYPRLRAELERLQIIQANMKTEISVLWTDLQRKAEALRAAQPFLQRDVNGCSDECGPQPCGHTPVRDALVKVRAALGDSNG